MSARPSAADVPPAVLQTLLDDLLQHELPTAPHVLARLIRELDGDLPTIREVAAHLTPPQRSGLRPLPSPLPLVHPIAVEYGGLDLADEDRDILLAVALTLDDPLDRICRFAGLSAADIAASAAGRHLDLHAGRCRLADRRLGVWLRETTAPVVQLSVHERLSVVAREQGDAVSADWHWARSSLRGAPATAVELTRIARELSEAGEVDRALMLAAEAAAHAFGVDRDEARLVAGMAALGAGYAMEADEWLSGLFPDGAERYRLQALGGLIVARAHLNAAVPDISPGALRPASDDAEDWYSWARASAFAAVLCAERGDRAGVRVWLEALREGSARTGAERELRDPVVALCWLLIGDGDGDEERPSGTGPLSGAILGGLRAAVDGDVDAGLQLLAGGAEVGGPAVDPFVAGFEHSPVVVAYREVAEVLLHVWRGDLGVARARLIEASQRGPVAMPFAGLGVLLARRLDLAVQGCVGPFGRSLIAVQPPAARGEQLIDRSLEAHLRGDIAESVELFALAGTREAAAVFDVVDFDEVAPPGGLARDRRVEPPEQTRARELRASLRVVGGSADERTQVQEEARSFRSPFARARLESMLGGRALIRGEHADGRRHLETAIALFEEAGASAWTASVRGRLELAGRDADGGVPDPLESCRRVWRGQLTARELEVAMLVVGGATNREIGDALSVSVRTVEVHVGRLLSKFEVRTRVELTALAHRTNQYV